MEVSLDQATYPQCVEEELCCRFCAEILGNPGEWSAAEHQALFHKLPFVFQHLYCWLGFARGEVEEVLVRVFHPKGPVSSSLQSWSAPVFVFPLERLPPRAIEAAVEDMGVKRARGAGSPLFDNLSAGRLSRSSSGHVNGLCLTAEEFMLACLVHYVVSEAAPSAGFLSIPYERLLLAHLQMRLPHSEFELAEEEQPHTARFLLDLIHEFWLSPHSSLEAFSGGELRSADTSRTRLAAVHAVRLVTLHTLANPSLRRQCQEVLGGGLASSGLQSRCTREVFHLLPPIVELLREFVTLMAASSVFDLDRITSVMKLWLLVLQPWKAPRLYASYLANRPPNPVLETSHRPGFGDRDFDVALVGLEPDAPSEKHHKPTGAGHQAAAQDLVFSESGASLWRNYVVTFQSAYLLLEAFLSLPAHQEICLPLGAQVAGLCARDAVGIGRTGTESIRSTQEILRHRSSVNLLLALAQALICFTDPELLHVLLAVPSCTAVPPDMPLLVDGALSAKVVLAVSSVWIALLGSTQLAELRPLMSVLSERFQSVPLWSQYGLPHERRPDLQRPFALRVLQDLGHVRRDFAHPVEPAGRRDGMERAEATYIPSEWQRPLEEGEVEVLLQATYWFAMLIDQLLGFSPRLAGSKSLPQTEWPRIFASWKLAVVVVFLLVALVLPW